MHASRAETPGWTPALRAPDAAAWDEWTRRNPASRDMLAYMQRTTVKLPDDLDARLRHEAKRQGVTIAQITRTALEAHLGSGRRRRLTGAAAARSGTHDISERIEEIIGSEIAPSH